MEARSTVYVHRRVFNPSHPEAGMQVVDHFRSFCSFWKPSVSRRITLYFLIFGMIIFVITSILYIGAANEHFTRSMAQLIRQQFIQLEHSRVPDFIWNGIGNRQPELRQLVQEVADLSSGLFVVDDVSLYCRQTDNGTWHRLSFAGEEVLLDTAVNPDVTQKLERHFRRSVSRAMAAIFHRNQPEQMTRRSLLRMVFGEEWTTMFVNITRDNDRNQYFLALQLDSRGMIGMLNKRFIHIGAFLVIILAASRWLAYIFTRKIAGPIEKLSRIATEVAGGDLSQKAPVTRKDEIGRLAADFNTMVDGLRERDRMRIIEFELEKGRQIQKDFLPVELPQVPNWEIAICFQPAGKVAGDFYDVFTLPHGSVGLVIADVCDKGVGSALYMALFRSLIRVFSIQGDSGGHAGLRGGAADREIVRNAVSMTNDYIAQNHGDECMFATLFFGVLDPDSGTLAYINAGHEPLYIVNSTGIRSALMPTGPAVGLMPAARFRIQSDRLDQGEMLLGYTDGVTEARSAEDKPFTRERLQSLLQPPMRSAPALLDAIKQELFNFIDRQPRNDDVTMLAVHRAPAV